MLNFEQKVSTDAEVAQVFLVVMFSLPLNGML